MSVSLLRKSTTWLDQKTKVILVHFGYIGNQKLKCNAILFDGSHRGNLYLGVRLILVGNYVKISGSFEGGFWNNKWREIDKETIVKKIGRKLIGNHAVKESLILKEVYGIISEGR